MIGHRGRNRILFLIRSLGHGGAERQLIELVKRLDDTRFQITVVTYYDDGALRGDLEAVEHVEVVSLHKRSRWDLAGFFWRLWQLVRAKKPDVVHGFNMGLSNELALIFGRLVGAKVVWGLRASNRDFADYDALTRWGFRLGKWSSRFVHLMIANAHASKAYYESFGYDGSKIRVIPNGIDTEHFRPDAKARQQMRQGWWIDSDQILIGLVARLHPMKDVPTFLRAAALLAESYDNVRFVIVGSGDLEYQQRLQELASSLGLDQLLIWAGARDDMPAVHNALDVATSSSAYGEGFSNTVAEAMACGVPCVVTDVGDSALVVGNAGKVVPPRSPKALAMRWQSLIKLSADDKKELGCQARCRIVSEFSPERLAQRTAEALLEVASL